MSIVKAALHDSDLFPHLIANMLADRSFVAIDHSVDVLVGFLAVPAELTGDHRHDDQPPKNTPSHQRDDEPPPGPLVPEHAHRLDSDFIPIHWKQTPTHGHPCDRVTWPMARSTTTGPYRRCGQLTEALPTTKPNARLEKAPAEPAAASGVVETFRQGVSTAIYPFGHADLTGTVCSTWPLISTLGRPSTDSWMCRTCRCGARYRPADEASNGS
jgi:hypothetical protein